MCAGGVSVWVDVPAMATSWDTPRVGRRGMEALEKTSVIATPPLERTFPIRRTDLHDATSPRGLDSACGTCGGQEGPTIHARAPVVIAPCSAAYHPPHHPPPPPVLAPPTLCSGQRSPLVAVDCHPPFQSHPPSPLPSSARTPHYGQGRDLPAATVRLPRSRGDGGGGGNYGAHHCRCGH